MPNHIQSEFVSSLQSSVPSRRLPYATCLLILVLPLALARAQNSSPASNEQRLRDIYQPVPSELKPGFDGVVKTPDGALVVGATIEVTRERKPIESQVDFIPSSSTDKSGRFVVSLPPATYKLWITAKNFKPRLLHVTVEPRKREQLEVVLSYLAPQPKTVQ